jgi:hypothetical protein
MLGNLHVRLCVQRRLVCSVGGKPTGVKARSPVAWIAEGREIEPLEPIDEVIYGMAASCQAVAEANAQVAPKVRSPGGRARNRKGEGCMGESNTG